MASIEGLKRRITALKPKVQSAFIVYLTPRESPVKEVDDEFQVVVVDSSSDPLFAQVAPPWLRKEAAPSLDNKDWRIIVALKDGRPIGRIWEVLKTDRRFFAGIPRMRLAPDETLMFDLFVEREYRRSNIGMTMADWFFRYYSPEITKVQYVYGFISYENAASILWHYSIGFNIAQTVNYLSIGDRIKWRIPFSDVPRFGPLSRKGRHSEPDKELFGTSLFPNL